MNEAELQKLTVLLQKGLDSWDQAGRRSQGGLVNLNLTSFIQAVVAAVGQTYEEKLQTQEKRIADLETRLQALE